MSRRRPAETSAGAAADIMTGDLVVREGDVLTPSRIGALAAIGQAEVTVYAKPRVAILSTGNEVVEPGQPLKAGQVYDVNRFTLAAIVEAHGGVPRSHKAAQDTLESLAGRARRVGSNRTSSSFQAAARSVSAIWSWISWPQRGR